MCVKKLAKEAGEAGKGNDRFGQGACGRLANLSSSTEMESEYESLRLQPESVDEQTLEKQNLKSCFGQVDTERVQSLY